MGKKPTSGTNMPYLRPRPITVKEIEALAKETGRHSVGDGLILNVGKTGRGCSWTCRLRVPSGKRRDIGLGSYPEVTLAEARQRAADYRRMTRDGLDPIEERKMARRASTTFETAAEACWKEKLPTFKNQKHGHQYITTLRTYAYPFIAKTPITDVDHVAVKDLLRPIWLTKKETASRVLQRVADVCSWAVSEGLREAELPRNVIRRGLPKQNKKVTSYAAVPLEDAPAMYAKLAEQDSPAANALRFQILTALRPGVGRTAQWSEFDLRNGLWNIPAERMKVDEEHIVPLSPGALTLIKMIKSMPLDIERDSPFLFPSPRKPMQLAISDTSVTLVSKKLMDGITLHGWRSTFEDWATEYTDFPDSVIDAAMAHKQEDAVKAAYRRTKFLEQRLELMTQWNDFLEGRIEVRETLDGLHRKRLREMRQRRQASPE